MMNIFHHTAPRPPVVPGEETGCLREVEGRSRSPDPAVSPPNYLRWAVSFQVLLADPQGVTLFSKYLHQEGQSHADSLNFWFACNGLHKTTDSDRIQQIVKAIYKRFFLKSQIVVSDVIRKSIHSTLKKSDQTYSVSIFDAAQQEVEKIISETTYPNFLKSEIYLAYVRSMQSGPGTSNEGSSSEGSNYNTTQKVALATLHEDQELDTSTVTAPPPLTFAPLTKDSLIMTQKVRAAECRPSTEAYADFLHGKPGMAKMYSSYNPVSRQDSELQSLSSDARTESDNMSLTDSSIDGMSVGGHFKLTRKQYQMHCRKVKEAAFLNRDPYSQHTVIPRTEHVSKEQSQPMKPEKFAAILTEKLERIKKEQEVQEKLDHKLFESNGKSLAEAIRERFQIDDDDGQHILDQHVSRVWSDRTPGNGSPRPRSPDLHRPARLKPQTAVKSCSVGVNSVVPNSYLQTVHTYQTRPYTKHLRKEKDAFSTFSSDSGNVHDFTDCYERLHMPKSKSVPDYSESSDTYSSLPGYGVRQSREWNSNSRRYNKKPEPFDSGVSVVSESTSHHSAQCKRVMCWLMESEQHSVNCGHLDRNSPTPCCNSNSSRCDYKYPRSNPQLKGRKSPPPEWASLEEAKRRLEDQAKNKSRQRASMTKSEGIQSGGSTLRSKASDQHLCTTVVFSFCDEQVPYRSKIPGTSVTLKQFKEYLPKKGNYRYFFKTECEELDMKVIQEEITDDNEILPFWEGKIMAQVKPIE